MPELPDVEGFRHDFNRLAARGRVERVEVLDRTMIRNSSPQAIGRALKGRRLGPASRHGKWLLAPAEGPTLLLHFGMTGLLDGGQHYERNRHDRLLLHLEDGVLAYRNMRKLGGVWLARDREAVQEVTGKLGPDAGRIRRDDFLALVRGRHGGVKALLMDQSALAGVGNLLSDEVLWRARIHPRRQAAALRPRTVGRLHEELRQTITEANRHARIPPERGWLTGARDRREGCPRCGTRVAKGAVAGRTACWCPRCQRRPPS